MKLQLEEKEQINEFRLAEFVYNLCEEVGISANATKNDISSNIYRTKRD